MEDSTLRMALLFDFFGELLTDKQREYFDLYFNEDLSLSEIAENAGISRQGVRAFIVKAESALNEYEEKTGVVRRFTAMQRELEDLSEKAERLCGALPEGTERRLAEEIAAGIDELKGWNNGI